MGWTMLDREHFLHARCMWFCHARCGKSRHRPSYQPKFNPTIENANVSARVLATCSGTHTLYSVDFELDLDAVEPCRIGAAARSKVCAVASFESSSSFEPP